MANHQVAGFENSDSNLLIPKVEQEILSLMEDSLDGGPPSVGSGDIPTQSPMPVSTPLTGNKKVSSCFGLDCFKCGHEIIYLQAYLLFLFFCSCRKQKTRMQRSWSLDIFYIQAKFERGLPWLTLRLLLEKLVEKSEMK